MCQVSLLRDPVRIEAILDGQVLFASFPANDTEFSYYEVYTSGN